MSGPQKSIVILTLGLAFGILGGGSAQGCFSSTPLGTPASTNLYDSRDWLRQSIQNPGSGVSATTSFTNDAAGRLLSVTDPLLRTTRFGYDADSRRTNTTNAAQRMSICGRQKRRLSAICQIRPGVAAQFLNALSQHLKHCNYQEKPV